MKKALDLAERSQTQVDKKVRALEKALDGLKEKETKPEEPVEPTDPEDKEADEKAAQAVEDLIADLPEDITLDSKKAVKEARDAYDALTEEYKELVTNIKTLKSAEARIKELEAEQAEEERQAQVVAETKKAIDAAESLEALEEIKIDDTLSEANKAKVETAIEAKKIDLKENNAIEDAIKEDYDKDKEIIDKQEQDVIDYYNKKFAKEVSDKIGSIPSLDKLTLADIVTVESARKEYNSLTEEQKKLVSNLDTLKSAEAKIKELEAEQVETDRQAKIVEDTKKEIEAAESLEVLEAIEIPEDISEANNKILVDAKNKQKAELEKIEADKEVDKKAAQAVEAQITALGEITLESKEAVKEAIDAFDKLSDEQKKLVENLNTLTAAEAKIKELEAEQVETDRQAKIVEDTKKVIKSAESLEALEALEIDESLSEANKAILEKAIADKKTELEKAKEEADEKAAEVVVNQITALGEINLDSKDAVEAARAAYDALTEEQKALVTNLGTLTEAEAKIEKLEQAKEEAEQAEKERQAKIVADTLADIKSAKDLEALGKITIDESLSEENKIELENIKSDKSIEIKENNYKIAIEEIKTQVDSTIKTLNGQRKLNVEKFEKDKISFKVTFILEKKVGQRFYSGPDVKATRDSSLFSIATSSGMLYVKTNQFKEIEKYIDTIEYNGEKVNGLSSAINKAPNKVGEVIDMNHNVKLKLKDEYGDNKILEFDIIAELAE